MGDRDRNKMKDKTFDRKWQKMPPRYSRKWYILMHEIMRNFMKVFVNVKIANPSMTGFGETTINYLKHLEERSTYDPNAFLGVTEWGYAYGLGRILYQLQPYLLPWVKISKAKLAKEFRAFIIDASNIRNKRMRQMETKVPWLKVGEGSTHYLSLVGWNPKVAKQRHPIKTLTKWCTPLWDDCYIAICRNEEGRTVLGQFVPQQVSLDSKVWVVSNQVKLVSRLTYGQVIEKVRCFSLKNHDRSLRAYQVAHAHPESLNLTPTLQDES